MAKTQEEAVKVKPRTKRAKRILEKREPKLVCIYGADGAMYLLSCSRFAAGVLLLSHHRSHNSACLQVEEVKTALLLHGSRTSAVTKVKLFLPPHRRSPWHAMQR